MLIHTPGGVAVEVKASPARFASAPTTGSAEVDAGRAVLARADDRFGRRPKRVAADTAYGSAAFLAFVHDHGAVPHIPVLERSGQTKGKFPREAFRPEREHDHRVCLAGKVLACRATDHPSGFIRYNASATDCRVCHLQRTCTRGISRAMPRSEREDVRELVRAGMRTPLFQRSMRLRRGVERLFADARGKRGQGRLSSSSP